MDEQQRRNYTVYAHRSKLDHKVYIGATRQPLSKRFASGLGYTKCTRFWQAIQEQGFHNFDHIVIADGLTKSQAMKMEESLVDLLGTMNPNVGYNMRKGGEHNIPCEEICKKISKAQMGHTVNPTLTEKQKKLFGRPVVQLSRDGTFLFAYASLKEAARDVSGNATNIWAACNGKQATSYGFKWRFLDETNGEYDDKIKKAGITANERFRDAFARAWNKAKKRGAE